MGKLKDFRSVPTTFLTKTDNLTSGRTRQDDEEPPFRIAGVRNHKLPAARGDDDQRCFAAAISAELRGLCIDTLAA